MTIDRRTLMLASLAGAALSAAPANAASVPAGGLDAAQFGRVVRLSGEHGRLVATDAGGNSLLSIGPTGRVSTLAVFPDRGVPPFPGAPNPFPMHAVPARLSETPGTIRQIENGCYW